MTSEHETSHLSPEIFVDLVEGSPVEASRQQHLSTCAQCREELMELEQTLSLLHEDTGASALLEPVRPARRGFPAWAATAAAVLMAAVGLYWLVAEKGPGAAVPRLNAEIEELLPPIDEDQEFQFLLAVSDATTEDSELVEITAPVFDGLALDPAPLTPGERQRFVERLTEEMRSSL